MFASSEKGNTDIYVVPTDGGVAQRLTTSMAIDTQPAWAPNGRQIVFTSTRSGRPQLFLMDADGSNVRQLTFEGEFHDEAAWSDDGTRIVCTTRVDNRFQLATIDVITGERTVIPGPGNNESPCFSPDGSMLAFVSDRTGTPADLRHRRRGAPAPADPRGRQPLPGLDRNDQRALRRSR